MHSEMKQQTEMIEQVDQIELMVDSILLN